MQRLAGTVRFFMVHCRRVCVIATQLILLAAAASAANLALQVSNEIVPAGGWAQIKIFAATPQLVAAGRIAMRFDPMVFGDIAAVAVFSPQGDAAGIATVSGPTVMYRFDPGREASASWPSYRFSL